MRPEGHLLTVGRDELRQAARPTLKGTLHITPERLPDGGTVMAGEQVTAKVTLTVPTELEYVMVEVPKPAGCEPLNPLSGWDARLIKAEVRMQNAELEAGKPGSAPPATGSGDARSATWPTGEEEEDEGREVYREEHDDKSVFFLDRLEPGTWEIRFGMRAVTPGDFRALPVQATAMYVPEITANSDARRVRVEEREGSE